MDATVTPTINDTRVFIDPSTFRIEYSTRQGTPAPWVMFGGKVWFRVLAKPLTTRPTLGVAFYALPATVH